MSKQRTRVIEHDEMHDEVATLGAPDVFYSAYKAQRGSRTKVRVPYFEDVAFEGRVRFHFEAWESEYTSPPYINPTHADMLREMQKGMEVTGDHHHSFFEGARVKGTQAPEKCAHCGREPEAGEQPATIIEIITGS